MADDPVAPDVLPIWVELSDGRLEETDTVSEAVPIEVVPLENTAFDSVDLALDPIDIDTDVGVNEVVLSVTSELSDIECEIPDSVDVIYADVGSCEADGDTAEVVPISLGVWIAEVER